MIINRNNYEEFFLLYVDNELSAADRMAVESFVRENPDLEKELDMLKQSTFKPDESISFEHKELLMSGTGGNSFINNTNYEEFFLLYTDGELNEENKKAVEEFASHHAHLREELELLQQTRLDPNDAVLFAHKEILYRREEDKKLFWLPRVSIAAASLLLLLAGYLLFKNSTTHTGSSVVVAKNDDPGNTKTKDLPKKKLPAVTRASVDSLYTATGKEKETAMQETKKENQLKLPVKDNRKLIMKKNDQDKNVTAANLPPRVVPVKPDNDLPAAIVKREHKINTDLKSASLNPVANIPVVEANKEVVTDVAVGKPEVNPFASQAVVNEQAPDTENEVNIIAFSSRKNKMRGFFRKVSRVFEKTTNVNDDRNKGDVLIGNFQIALK